MKQFEEKEESRVKAAIKLYVSGCNCAQSVLLAFQDITDISEDNLFKISYGLGAGMGRLQQTCGAVTAAYLLIGLIYGNQKSEGQKSKEKVYKFVREFNDEFIKRNKTTSCRELLNCDLNTDEGKKCYKDNNLSIKICVKCVKHSVNILNELILSNKE